MSNKFKKSKEDIRDQILTKARYYRNYRRIHFFDNTIPTPKYESYVVDGNEMVVLLIRFSRSKKILVTTKYIIIISKRATIKIHGDEIDRYDYMEHINYGETYETASYLKLKYFRFKIMFRIGKYRIVKKDGSHVDLFFKRAKYPDCLNECIKKLKFVTHKYESY